MSVISCLLFVYHLSDFDSGSQSNLMCEFFFSDYSIFSMYIEFSLNFLLFLLSQIVKLKTKKIKPFCFARAKYFRFVDVAFCFPVCVSLPFFVVVCVCVSCNEKFDFTAVRGELRAVFHFLVSGVETQNDHKITKIKKVKTCTEQH